MKRSLLVLLCLAALALSAGTAAAAEKTWEFSFTSAYNDRHPVYANAWKPWMDAINKETGGLVKIQYFNIGTISPEQEVFASVESGLVTFGGQSQSRTPGKYPYAEVIDLPLLTTNAEAGSMLSWAGFQHFKAMQEEEKGMKVLWHWTSAPFALHTVKKQVKSLDDLKGMKLIAWFPSVMDTIRALGASPIQVPPPDTYLALQRGMADGVLCPLAPIRSIKVNEVAKFTTVCNLMVSNLAMGMNWAAWNELPDDIKSVFEKNSGEKMARMAGKALDDADKADRELLTSQGHTFIDLGQVEKARWSEAVTPIYKAWLKKMEGKGLAEAPVIFKWHQEMGKKYADEVSAKK